MEKSVFVLYFMATIFSNEIDAELVLIRQFFIALICDGSEILAWDSCSLFFHQM